MTKHLRINRQIRVPTVRLIDDSGQPLGIMAFEKALQIAEEQQLDLAEVVPNANPPVCKLMDYGKYQYHQNKIETRHRKSQKKMEIKGIRLGFKTGDHDIDVRVKQSRKFLESGNSVKVTLIFRGREAMYKDLGKEKMLKFYEALKDIAVMEAPPKGPGNMLIMILNPIK